jgi:AraC-like DNA-binding protein
MLMDPLSDVLSVLKPRSYGSGGIAAGGDWAIQFPGHQGIKCYAVVTGACWLALDGVAEPVRLQTGDCFLLASGRPFRLGSDLTTPPVAAETVLAGKREGGLARCNGGGDFVTVGSHFLLAGKHADLLLRTLPPIAHIRDESERAALRWAMLRMKQELIEQQPGGELVAEHLAHMMLVQVLRQHLTETASGGVGWLFALADPQLATAIRAIHDDPAHRWTVEELASHAAMSRSTFALRFKQKVGAAPMDYLTRWRMTLAGDRLEHSNEPVSAIARSLGYDSESAFSTAFKRVMGRAPRRYARNQDPDAPVPYR